MFKKKVHDLGKPPLDQIIGAVPRPGDKYKAPLPVPEDVTGPDYDEQDNTEESPELNSEPSELPQGGQMPGPAQQIKVSNEMLLQALQEHHAFVYNSHLEMKHELEQLRLKINLNFLEKKK